MLQSNIERTLAIIKPDAFSFRLCGAIISEIEKNDLNIVGIKVIVLNADQAESFYKDHIGKPYFQKLMKFMTSGPIMVIALEGIKAISNWRKIMGNTDYNIAEDGTIRKNYATDVTYNAVHGSDGLDTAKRELDFFFKPEELLVTVPVNKKLIQ